jgi:Tfp pilus assembly protein PilF
MLRRNERPGWAPLGSAVLAASLLAALGGCGASETSKSQSSVNHLLAATQALEGGDDAAAMQELTAAIDDAPNAWAYFKRAQLHLKGGNEAEANADCQKGLELNEFNPDLKWLSGELKKPAAQRFKGRFAKAPSG